MLSIVAVEISVPIHVFDLISTAEISTIPRSGYFLKMIRYSPHSLAKPSLPFGTLERLNVAPLGVILLLKIVDGSLKSVPHAPWEFQELLFSVSREFNAVARFLRRARVLTFRA
jgi:hypothetical protein